MKPLSYFISFSLLMIKISAQICGLIVPENPLSYQGLNTPYILKSFTGNAADCSVLDQRTTVFVEIVIFDISASTFYIYNPLVVNRLKQIKIYDEIPQLPDQNIVGIWFGSNGVTFKLIDSNNSLHFGDCIDGYNGSIFGNFAYCNARIFFTTISKYRISIPNIGKTVNGFTCLTTRSFEFNEQYQISNVISSYIVLNSYKIVMKTIKNLSIFKPLFIIISKSNGYILNNYISIATGCTIFAGYDFTEQFIMKTSMILNEIYASLDVEQVFIPSTHPSVTIDGVPNLNKLNLYRIGLNQSTVSEIDYNDSRLYCDGIYKKTPIFLYKHHDLLNNYITPDETLGNSLLNVMISRFLTSWNTYNCTEVLKVEFPIKYLKDYNNVIVYNNVLSMYNISSNNTETNKPATQTINIYLIGLITVSILSVLICIYTIRERIKRNKIKNEVIELMEKKEEQDILILEIQKNQLDLDFEYENLHKKHTDLEQKLMNIIIVDQLEKAGEMLQKEIEIERHKTKQKLNGKLEERRNRKF